MTEVLFFAADNGITGIEPYYVDPFSGDVVSLGDLATPNQLYNENGDSNPSGGLLKVSTPGGRYETASMGSKFFFSAFGDSVEQDLHVFDLEDNTLTQLDVFPHVRFADPDSVGLRDHLFAFQDRVYFKGPDGHLWKSDGTQLGTEVVASSLTSADWPVVPEDFIVLGQHLFFSGRSGRELWKTDGTASGTELVANWYTQGLTSFDFGLNLNQSAVFDGELYFSGAARIGSNLWKTDGTEEGTVLVSEVSYSGGVHGPRDFIVLGDHLYFTGPSAPSSTDDRVLWRTDGTSEGTQIVNNIHVGISLHEDDEIVIMGDNLIFAGFPNGDRNEGGIWISDGTAEGTREITSFGNTNAQPYNLTSLGDRVVFSSRSLLTHQETLWVTDGTELGTVELREVSSAPVSSAPHDLIRVDDLVYFQGHEAETGWELWVTDGTLSGTRIVEDINTESIGYIDGDGNEILHTDNSYPYMLGVGNLSPSNESGDPEPTPAPTSAILNDGNSNINIDGAFNVFTDFGGADTYTILGSINADVTITDTNASLINLPSGLVITSALFLSNGVQFTIDGHIVTLLGDPASFTFVFGGTPLDANAGTPLTYTETAAVFGTTVPAAGGAAANEGAITGQISADGTIKISGTTLDSFFVSNSPVEPISSIATSAHYLPATEVSLIGLADGALNPEHPI